MWFLAVVYWVTVLTTPKWYSAYIVGTTTARGKAKLATLSLSLTHARSVRCEANTDFAGNKRANLALSKREAKTTCAALRSVGKGLRA